MKRLIPILAFLVIVGFISQAEAAQDTCGMSVTVTVAASVSVTDKPLTFGSVAAGDSDVNDAPGCTVTNNGEALNTYSLQITAKPATWSVKETAGSTVWNEFRLLGLFTSSSPPGLTDFLEADDIVKTTQTAADVSIYAITAEDTTAKGYGCTENAVRKLWFKFDAPSGTDLTEQQWITVTVYTQS